MMENNYYMKVTYEYDATIKGKLSKVETYSVVHHKYLTMESIEELIKEVRKFSKEDSCKINFYIDNIDWYVDPLLVCRIIHDWNSLYLVNWDLAEQRNYNSVSKTDIESKDIRKIVHSYIDRVNNYVKEEINK